MVCDEILLTEEDRLRLPAGETIDSTESTLVIRFPDKRSVLSTS